jgi:hypothetical protein
MAPQPGHFVGSDVGMTQDGREMGFRYQQRLLMVSVRPPTGCGFMSELTDKELKNLRKIMLQCWADMLDAWVKGESAKELIADAKRHAAEVHDDEVDDDL